LILKKGRYLKDSITTFILRWKRMKSHVGFDSKTGILDRGVTHQKIIGKYRLEWEKSSTSLTLSSSCTCVNWDRQAFTVINIEGESGVVPNPCTYI
jgi:hypothetical protein